MLVIVAVKLESDRTILKTSIIHLVVKDLHLFSLNTLAGIGAIGPPLAALALSTNRFSMSGWEKSVINYGECRRTRTFNQWLKKTDPDVFLKMPLLVLA